jgi:hypothetical protein
MKRPNPNKNSRIFNKLSLINLFLHIINRGKIIVLTIHLSLPGVARGMADTKSKVRWELFT